MDGGEREEGSYPELFPEDFGERLERLIELAGLSREEFAERLGIEYESVAEWFDASMGGHETVSYDGGGGGKLATGAARQFRPAVRDVGGLCRFLFPLNEPPPRAGYS